MSNLSGRRCLVLGATGFIGWNLCQHLLQRGALVRAVLHDTFSDEHRQERHIDWIRGDITNREFIIKALDAQEFVFHLVSTGMPDRHNAQPTADIAENVIPALQLAELCVSAGTQHLIFVSSGGTVYGKGHQCILKESDPTRPLTAYGSGKLAVENYLAVLRLHLGLRSSVLRISNPYGPHQNPSKKQGLIAKVINCALHGQTMVVWGDGGVVRDFIHIDDVVAAMLAVALYDGSEHTFNVGSGIGISVNDVIALTRRVTGVDLSVQYFEGRAVDVPANVLDISLITQSTGWFPQISIENGLRSTFNWYLSRQGSL